MQQERTRLQLKGLELTAKIYHRTVFRIHLQEELATTTINNPPLLVRNDSLDDRPFQIDYLIPWRIRVDIDLQAINLRIDIDRSESIFPCLRQVTFRQDSVRQITRADCEVFQNDITGNAFERNFLCLYIWSGVNLQECTGFCNNSISLQEFEIRLQLKYAPELRLAT